MARLLTGLFCLLQGGLVNGQIINTSIPGTTNQIYPDVEDGTCTPGGYCTPNAGILIPTIRGLCVAVPGMTQQCWDACNDNHTLDLYGAGQPATTQKALAMMVKQLRTGRRYGSCPGSASAAAARRETICNPGERCTPPGLTWGRGMCITMAGNGTGLQQDACLDMCDTSIPETTWKSTPGKQAGTLRMVRQVQAGRDPSGLTTCPGISVWVWLWFPIFLCCAIGCCAGSYYSFMYYKNRIKPNRSYREPVNEPFMEDGQGMGQYNDFPQGQPQEMDAYPPPQTMDAMEDPMPVIEPQQEPLLAEVPVAPAAFVEEKVEPNLFDQPNLMAGLAPLTVAAPTASYPVAGSNYITSYQAAPQYTTSYAVPQAASMSVAAPVYVAGGATTVTPSYGAYGAYGTTYPGTTSMRIG